MSTSSHNLTTNLDTLESCFRSLHSWFCYNWLALNSDKPETILLDTSIGLRNCPSFTGVNLAVSPVAPSDKIVTLKVTLDDGITMNNHILNVCRSSYFHIQVLCHITFN